MILSGDWAGVHYWNVITDESGAAQPMDTMTFMHFANTDDSVRADMCNVNQGL